jgi:hypothetical protein
MVRGVRESVSGERESVSGEREREREQERAGVRGVRLPPDIGPRTPARSCSRSRSRSPNTDSRTPRTNAVRSKQIQKPVVSNTRVH